MKHSYSRLVILFFLLLITPITWAASNRLYDARISTVNGKTRIVFALNQSTDFRYFTLKNPDRAVIDINNIMLKTRLKQLLSTNHLIKNIRSARRDKNNLRIVLDLNKPIVLNAFLLKSENNMGPRLVVDLMPPAQKQSAQISKQSIIQNSQKRPQPPQITQIIPQKIKTEAVKTEIEKPIKTILPKRVIPKGRKIFIVIDPGHGGKDPGASGPHGIDEKMVVLSISKDLVRLLNRIPGFHAQLTRAGDYYIGLRQRLQIARKDKADLFVAIHADAFKNPRSRGASVYALSLRGASSEAARWIAEKENYSEVGGVDLNELNDQSKILRSVLIDLSQTATISQSLHLGMMLLHSLKQVAILHYNKVEQARFVVLKSPDIPSLLVETGFISNPNEERRLSNPLYQKHLARALMIGIKNYFLSNPPRGTLIAQRQRTKDYVVKQGDTLNGIAVNFGVSVGQLMALNHLSSSTLKVNQKLKIPPQGRG